jgi:hypothetical protein
MFRRFALTAALLAFPDLNSPNGIYISDRAVLSSGQQLRHALPAAEIGATQNLPLNLYFAFCFSNTSLRWELSETPSIL